MQRLRSLYAELRTRYLVPREVFFRSEDRFLHLRISVRQQILAGVAGLCLVSLALVSLGGMAWRVATGPDEELTRYQLAYADLLESVVSHHRQFARITKDLEDNQAYLQSVLAEEAGADRLDDLYPLKQSAGEKAAVVLALEGLQDKMAGFQAEIDDIGVRDQELSRQLAEVRRLVSEDYGISLDESDARETLLRDLSDTQKQIAELMDYNRQLSKTIEEMDGRIQLAAKTEGVLREENSKLSGNLASLEQSLTASNQDYQELQGQMAQLYASLESAADKRSQVERQRDDLQQRVANLEDMLIAPRGDGQTALAKLSNQTGASIQMMEEVLEMAGLDVNRMLGSRDFDGLGGPFMPVEQGSYDSDLQLETTVRYLERQSEHWKDLRTLMSVVPLAPPLENYKINSTFGLRKDPVNGRKSRHQGLDMGGRMGSDLYATAPGKVVFAGWRGYYGRVIEIDHGYGIRTRYGHLKKILVEVGDEVGYRDRIGLLGSSGRSTGPHVHYEVRVKGKPLDPLKFIRAGQHVFKG